MAVIMKSHKLTWYCRSSWEFYILTHRQQKEKETLDLAWGFETSNPTPSYLLPPIRAQLLQQDHTSESLPSSSIHKWPNIQIYELIDTITIKTSTTIMKKKCFFYIFYHIILHRNIYALLLKQDTPKSAMYILKVAMTN